MDHIRIVLKSDNEPVMKALTGRVKDLRSHPAFIEEISKHVPQSNWMAERCGQTAKGLLKTKRRAAEHRLGGRAKIRT